MIYRNETSLLAFGCMRLPSSMKDSEELIVEAVSRGINLFDTAYMYFGNEEKLGRILEKHQLRDKVRIATKCPPYLIKSTEDAEKIFQKELKNLRTTYIDHYLMHMLGDTDTWDRLVSIGMIEWLNDKKNSGQIRKVGFSFHGNTDDFLALIDRWDWDFCMIQYNYVDEHTQAGRKGLKVAHQKNIPVYVMEPLRGGNLTVGLSDVEEQMIRKTGKTPAELAFGWLYQQPEITGVFSGMSTMEMLLDNVRIVETFKSFSQEDIKAVEEIRAHIEQSKKVGCTTCFYCMPCPFGVDIPGCFQCYNVSYRDGYRKGFKEYLLTTTFKSKTTNASNCVACGRCEKKCPQKIPIIDALQGVQKRLETPVYRLIRWGCKPFFRRKRKDNIKEK